MTELHETENKNKYSKIILLIFTVYILSPGIVFLTIVFIDPLKNSAEPAAAMSLFPYFIFPSAFIGLIGGFISFGIVQSKEEKFSLSIKFLTGFMIISAIGLIVLLKL